jgi:hypothetical protein
MRGFPPGPVPEVARRFSVDLVPLYALHDGLVHLASHDGGPLPTTMWRLISDQRGSGLMEVWSEGGRGFGFDLSEDPVRAFYIDGDSTEDPVRPVDDPWAFFDEDLARWLEK